MSDSTNPEAEPAGTQYELGPDGFRSLSRRMQYALIAVGLIVAVALGALMLRGLNDSTVYFKTVSEAISQRSELAEKRFRLEGVVEKGSIAQQGDRTVFRLTDKGQVITVSNVGQPLGIFQDGIPVVVEGQFASNGDLFESDRIMVRHSSDYEAKHPDRVSGQVNQ